MTARQLMATVCEFQGASLRAADRSRLADALGVSQDWQPVVDRLLASPRARARLADEALARLGVDPREEVALITPRARLALLSGPDLVRLTDLAGAALLHDRIGRAIGGTEVRRLREALGADVHAFAVRRAPLLIGPGRPTAPWVEPDGEVAQQARTAGRTCLEAWLTGLPRGVAARVVLKLPAGLAVDPANEVPPSWRDRAGAVVERVARSELPAALPLLAGGG